MAMSGDWYVPLSWLMLGKLFVYYATIINYMVFSIPFIFQITYCLTVQYSKWLLFNFYYINKRRQRDIFVESKMLSSN